MKLSVVIPVYNEVATIEAVLAAVRAVPLEKEILVVDDGSTDGTRDRLKQLARAGDFRVIFHDRNRGKGAALRSAFSAVAGDIVVIQDADREYDPAEYPRLIEPILAGQADAVYGSRFFGCSVRGRRWWHVAGNQFLTTLSNFFTGLNLTDMETGHKAFRRNVLQAIRIEEDRFGVEPELTAKLAALGCTILEIPVSYRGRSRAEGKKIGLRDALRAVWCIVKYSRQRGAKQKADGAMI